MDTVLENSKKEEKQYTTYSFIIALLFFFFFTAPILSPFIKGFTIYLYWFIPFLDGYYIKYLLNSKYNKSILIILIIAVLALIFLRKYTLLIKATAIINTLIYLFYSKKVGLFKLFYMFMFFNVIICILQFSFLYINREWAYALGPTELSTKLWKQYATPTFTNFYTIFLFPRVCGLSREAGFFASLLGITFITYLFDDEEKKNIIKNILFAIGFILSLSKVSILFVAIIIMLKFKKIISKIPLFIGVAIFIFTCILISNTVFMSKYNEGGNESLVHRISGYTIMSDLPIDELVIGTERVEDLSNFMKYPFLNEIVEYGQFTGFPNMIVNQGLLVFLVFIVILYLCNVSVTGFLIFAMITFTTDAFTCTSFVVVGYYYILYYNKKLE